MKPYIGSIQRKRLRYYLVLSLGHHKQKWIALKTTDLATARARASRLAPPPSNEHTFLLYLIALGLKARAALDRGKTAAHAASPLPPPASPTEAHWRTLLETHLAALHLAHPRDLTPPLAQRITDAFRARYLSAPRILAYFRRAWKTLDLAPDIWPRLSRTLHAPLPNGKKHEFYRRLSHTEICRVLTYLRTTSQSSLAQEFADMLLLGYYTGLRLSDVAELEQSEIQEDAHFLSLQPNKVRYSKPRLLLIPLAPQARACILRRLTQMKDAPYLFHPTARKRPTKPLSQAFRACGVLKNGTGRASFHSLRATFISLMDEAGIPPHLTDAITGHAGGGMHARYTQPSAAALRAAVQKAIPPLTLTHPIRTKLEQKNTPFSPTQSSTPSTRPPAAKSPRLLDERLEQIALPPLNKEE